MPRLMFGGLALLLFRAIGGIVPAAVPTTGQIVPARVNSCPEEF